MTLVDIDLLFSGATTNCKYRGIENVLFSNTAFLLKNSNLHPWQTSWYSWICNIKILTDIFLPLLDGYLITLNY